MSKVYLLLALGLSAVQGQDCLTADFAQQCDSDKCYDEFLSSGYYGIEPANAELTQQIIDECYYAAQDYYSYYFCLYEAYSCEDLDCVTNVADCSATSDPYTCSVDNCAAADPTLGDDYADCVARVNTSGDAAFNLSSRRRRRLQVPSKQSGLKMEKRNYNLKGDYTYSWAVYLGTTSLGFQDYCYHWHTDPFWVSNVAFFNENYMGQLDAYAYPYTDEKCNNLSG